MRRIKLLLTSFAFVFALGIPALMSSAVSAQVACENPDGCQIQPCNNDLSVSKQVKVPSGSYVDAADAGNAPSAHVGDTIEWLIGVTKNLQGACEGTPNFPGSIVLHDTLPSGITYVSSVAGAGTYDSTSNDWSFTNLAFSSSTTIYLQLTTTANQVGSFENIATLSQLKVCDGEFCNSYDYAASSDDSLNSSQKDQVEGNNSADAWVNIQTVPQVLGESTTSDPQVLGLTNTGTSTLVQNIIAGLFIVSALGVLSWGTIFKKRATYKA